MTLAARELSLTQSAVSRHIKSLEEQLEIALFARVGHTIRLTAAGEAYARDVREALGKINTASFNVCAKGDTLDRDDDLAKLQHAQVGTATS
ncbi:LysR family transcriptional regulator [Bradyrhizobium sp. UFLA05-112]